MNKVLGFLVMTCLAYATGLSAQTSQDTFVYDDTTQRTEVYNVDGEFVGYYDELFEKTPVSSKAECMTRCVDKYGMNNQAFCAVNVCGREIRQDLNDFTRNLRCGHKPWYERAFCN